MFLVVLALTVTGAAQVVGTLLVLSLAITPAAAAQRLSVNPLIVAGLSILFAVVAADGGLLASFQSNVKASVFITSVSFAIYVAACLTGPLLHDRRRHPRHHGQPARQEAGQPQPAPNRQVRPPGRVSHNNPSVELQRPEYPLSGKVLRKWQLVADCTYERTEAEANVRGRIAARVIDNY